jgi:putative transcriptional regulator
MPEDVPAINLTNKFLIAMPGMKDGNFAGAVVYMCEHNDKGALGLVINRPIDINLRKLFDKVDLSLDREDLANRPVFLGGPVQTERGFVLHDRLDEEGGHYSSSLKIDGGLEMTTSRDVLEALSNGAGPRRVFITLGYSGWTAGQLEEELGRNGWLTVDAEQALIFDTPVEQRYDKALSLLGIDKNFLMGEAGHA